MTAIRALSSSETIAHRRADANIEGSLFLGREVGNVVVHAAVVRRDDDQIRIALHQLMNFYYCRSNLLLIAIDELARDPGPFGRQLDPFKS
ncbi:MAG TPA: hypothetical protein VLU47_16535, partial [Blastocatellia bacterium]|nr:hypothetical protein [Blastocatellia bacterium]